VRSAQLANQDRNRQGQDFVNFKSNPKRKPGKNRPASSRRLIQGPQLRDFTKESLKFFQGTSKLIVLAELWGCPKTATIYFRKAKCTQTGAQPGDAVGRLTRELSLSDPGAKFFREKREQTQKRRTLRPTGQLATYTQRVLQQPILRSQPRRLGPGSSPRARPRRESATRYLYPCIAIKQQGKNKCCPR
jgi:hypothetical protein